MLALAGRQMGYRFVVLDPTPDAPAAQVADQQILASFA
jgi:Phosphoribosylaminoimidazole carboxylase (NCAIR synthetase)